MMLFLNQVGGDYSFIIFLLVLVCFALPVWLVIEIIRWLRRH